jgi:hypothetical protein
MLVIVELVELAFGLLGIVRLVSKLVVVPTRFVELGNVVRPIGMLVVGTHVWLVVIVLVLAFVLGLALVLELAPMRVLGLGLMLEQVLGLGLVLVLELGLECVFAARLVGRQLGK